MKNKQKAFTLIELLVVISIIALLVAILMPALSRAKEQAKLAACVMNHKSLTHAWIMYSTENDDSLVDGHTLRGGDLEDQWYHWVEPPVSIDASGESTYAGEPARMAQEPDKGLELELNGIRNGALYEYLTTVDVYHCPSDNRSTKYLGAQDNVNTSNRMKGPAFRTYSMTGTMNGENYGTFPANMRATKSTQIKSPADVFTFLDDSDSRGWNMGSWQFRATNKTFFDPLAFWHPRKGTFSYADGHAETHEYQDQRTIDYALSRIGIKSVAGVDINSNNKDCEFLYRGYKAR